MLSNADTPPGFANWRSLRTSIALIVAALITVTGCADPCPPPRLLLNGTCVSRCPAGYCYQDGAAVDGNFDVATEIASDVRQSNDALPDAVDSQTTDASGDVLATLDVPGCEAGGTGVAFILSTTLACVAGLMPPSGYSLAGRRA